MGLDIVEYVIAVEDAFGLAIPNRDAARLETPGQLVDYLCTRLTAASDGPSLVQTAFYRLRAALVAELGVSRAAVRPDATLAQLTSRPERDVWRGVAARLGVEPKALTHAPVAGWLAEMRLTPTRTLGAVAEQLAMLRPAALKPPAAGWTRQQVEEVVLRLLEYETGIAVGPGDLGLTFVRDLGMG